VHLRFTVRSPEGDTLAQGEGDLAPAPARRTWIGHLWPRSYPPLRWVPLQGQFQAREEGQYKLTLDIPQPIDSVDVVIRNSIQPIEKVG
jgi:hypothetical protein